MSVTTQFPRYHVNPLRHAHGVSLAPLRDDDKSTGGNPIFLSFSSTTPCYTTAMTCPYCEAPIAPGAPVCTACNLTFPKTCDLFGAVPRIQREVHDSTGLLSSAQLQTIRKAILRIRNKYPQLYIQIVFHLFPPPHPMRTQVFWMFNASAFSGDIRRGPDNHTLLIAIDPDRMEAALMPGYGLEPFLNTAFLSDLLEPADPFWKHGDWSGGILFLLDNLDTRLENLTEPDASGHLEPDEF